MNKPEPKKDRQQRLAEKLRENLKRRKSQARARSALDESAEQTGARPKAK